MSIKTYAPLTEQEFAEGCGYTFNGIPLCEDEYASHVYAWGHIDRADYAAAVNALDEENGADGGYAAADVKHVWAIAIQPADGPEGWWVQWTLDGEPIPANHINAFPMTVVDR